jgi:hypothetical protein
MESPRTAAADGATCLDGPERAIARSVLYASLFDYPLSLAQLRQTLIEAALTPTEIVRIYDGCPALRTIVERRDGFFFPAGRHALVEERRRRETRSRAFVADHRRILTAICALPYVRMVALSGSIAHLNLDGAGDLDLFVVTRRGRVWSVTVAIILLAKIFGRRRSICANFVLAENRLALDQPDLFTASQIIHLKPLVGAELFARLVDANPFVQRFYPNFHRAMAEPFDPPIARMPGWIGRTIERLGAAPAALAERVCRSAYRRYLMRRAGGWQTPDQVRLDGDCLKLHTQSHRRSILERFDGIVGDVVPEAGSGAHAFGRQP